MTSHACTESVRNREVEMYRPESHKVPGRDPNMSGTNDEGELGYFSNEGGFLVDSSLQGISDGVLSLFSVSLNLSFWKRTGIS